MALQGTWHEMCWALPGVSSCPAHWPSCSSCARSQVMQASAMTASLGAAAAALGSRYVWISPWLAGLGAWLTGSNLGGTAMFALLQKAAASRTGLSLLWLAAAQNGAGQLARMLSPACLMLAATSAGLKGQEGLLIRKFGPLVLWAIALIMLLLTAIMTPSPLVICLLVVLLALPCLPALRPVFLATSVLESGNVSSSLSKETLLRVRRQTAVVDRVELPLWSKMFTICIPQASSQHLGPIHAVTSPHHCRSPDTRTLRLNKPPEKHQPGWAYTSSAYHGPVSASLS